MSSYHRSSTPTAEENVARLSRALEQVRVEKEMTLRLQKLECKEVELKEQILREYKRTL
ncbi:hypothetical protein BGZ60DRAFT_409738 [Tricladium varicosporioides]|nr:hypothetical protein BGZ60DRAFT_409738 [Hymenoscyphus varicosporioides]